MDGKVFGDLTVIVEADPIVEYQKNRRGERVPVNRRAWNCICKCGKELVVKQNYLRFNPCCEDCRLKKRRDWASKRFHTSVAQIKSRQSRKSVPALNQLFNHYCLSADKRGLDFELSLVEFKRITSLLCHYCNKGPSMLHSTGGKVRPDQYIYNSIDRVDNKIGYVSSNCVPSCKTRNNMKRDLNVSEFLEAAERIFLHSRKSS